MIWKVPPDTSVEIAVSLWEHFGKAPLSVSCLRRGVAKHGDEYYDIENGQSLLPEEIQMWINWVGEQTEEGENVVCLQWDLGDDSFLYYFYGLKPEYQNENNRILFNKFISGVLGEQVMKNVQIISA